MEKIKQMFFTVWEKLSSVALSHRAVLSPVLYFFSFWILDLSFRACHSEAGGTALFDAVPTLFTLCWSLILVGISLLLPGKIKKAVMGIFLGFFAIFVLVNATLYHVAGSFLNFSDLAFAEMGVSFVSLQYLAFSWKIYFFTFLALGIGVLSIVLAPKKQNSFRFFPLICAAVMIVPVFGIGVLHEKYYDSKTHFEWTDTYEPGSATALYTEFTDSNETYLLCGTYQFLFRSLTSGFEIWFQRPTILKNLDDYFAGRSEELQVNEMTGILQDKNVLAIMMESIDTWMVTEEIMPNLYAISQGSLSFENHYTPLFLSAGTFSTEFTFNTGFYLPTTGTGASTYATNVYPDSLPNLFRKAGYSANSFHALDGSFYNRINVHPQWGYESFNDHGAMGLQADKECDTTLMEAYDLFCPQDRRFFSYLITYTGHGPYQEDFSPVYDKYREAALLAAERSGVQWKSESTWEQYVVAISHAMETDAFLGELFAQMQADGSAEDTCLILFGDHYSKYLTDVDFLHYLKGTTDENELCRTPFYVYLPGLEAQSVEKVTSTVDMLPTIANLFGLTYNPRYLVGYDAFGEEGGYVCFKDYSYIDENGYWRPENGMDMDPQEEERAQEVRKTLTASWNSVKINYFSYLEEKVS